VPEIFKGIVEVKAISREAGYRSKVAVWTTQEGVDPVGACVGLRGVRIQNIVNELNGERIDVVLWDPEAARFVAHALSPAQVTHVKIRQAENRPRSSCRTGSFRWRSARKGRTRDWPPR
jgi:N utilization substance protein A